MSTFARPLLVLAAVAALGTLASPQRVSAQGAPVHEHWIATWGTAQQLAVETQPPWVEPPPRELLTGPPQPSPIPPFPPSLADQTVRMVARASVGGRRVRLALSNALAQPPVRIGAVHLALRERDSMIAPASDRTVTFGGRASFTIEPGALVVSDPVDLAVPALAELAVSLYLPEDTGAVTTHALGLNTTYITRGNAVAAESLPGAGTNRTYFWLAGIEVLAAERAGAIVAFGDSITDGFSTTPDVHREWAAVLAARLSGQRATAHWAVVNAGISGNRVRRNVAGTSALARFDRDVLGRAGVRWLVLLEGINDITFSALPRAPDGERTTADQLIEALSQLVDRAHAHGIKVLGGTLTPMGGLWLHNPSTEAMRQAVNRWVRTGGKVDAVADFDAATRDPGDPERLRPDFDSGDHIHPNDAGNAAMASAIDIVVFDRR
jgi:lysophospholipase L1-like esterase